MESSFAQVSDAEEDRLPFAEATREPGRPPTADEDPYNCFIRRCTVNGKADGALSGLNVGLKDNISVAGIPMTLGSRFMEGYVPLIDATVVTRLLNAGVNVKGKLNMDEFSHGIFGFGTDPQSYGRSLNPHAPEYLSGGSSSGPAVAVASRAVDVAFGGDQGGSIRVPASWCGIVGLKPTHGLVPHTGVIGIDPVIDHIGPVGRSVMDVARILECIAGSDDYDRRQVGAPSALRYASGLATGIRGVRIGVLREGFGDEEADPDVEAVVRESIEVLKRAVPL